MTADRKSYIGGADAAAVAGVGLWGSPYSVWAEKSGLLDPEDRMEASERMRWGLILEKPLAQEWARQEGVTGLRSAPFRRLPDRRYVGGHPDFLGVHPVDGDIVIETKLSERASEWEGPDGTDTIPLQYFLQVQHYLLITGRQVGYLVVLVRGNELRSWRIERDQEVIEGLLEAYDDLWAKVESGEAPEVDGHEATAETLKRRYPRGEEAEIVADLPAQSLVESLIEVRRVLKEEEGRKTEIENRLKDRMGKASRLLAPLATITWRNNKDSTKVDWQSVAQAYRAILDGAIGFGEIAGVVEYETSPGGKVAQIDRAGLDALESVHTNTIPGARVFRVTVKSEE